MSWESFEKALESIYVTLVEDGDSVIMRVVGEPEVFTREVFGRKQLAFFVPVVTFDGLRAWVLGKRTGRNLQYQKGEIGKKDFQIVRKGAKGSTATTYEVLPIERDGALDRCESEQTAESLDTLRRKVFQFAGVETGDEVPW